MMNYYILWKIFPHMYIHLTYCFGHNKKKVEDSRIKQDRQSVVFSMLLHVVTFERITRVALLFLS
jgi:hypothetical protein